MKLKIRQTALSPSSTQIWLDNMEISGSTSRLTLNMDVDEITQVTLKMRPSEIDIDAETLVALEAFVKKDNAA